MPLRTPADRRSASPLWIALSLLCFAAGTAIIAQNGLPQRAEATGIVMQDTAFAPEQNALAPPFTLTEPDGGTFNLLTLRGKPIILNFWATWCEPCAIEMPELQRLHEQFGDDVVVVGVNVGESPSVVQVWLEQHGLTFRIAMDTDMEISRLYALRGQPTTYVISPEGRITAIFYGPTTMTPLIEAVGAYVSS